jgi:hypothetical protein
MLKAHRTRAGEAANSPVMNSLYILDDFSHLVLLGLGLTVLHDAYWPAAVPAVDGKVERASNEYVTSCCVCDCRLRCIASACGCRSGAGANF